ncbi:hypothetical protein POM88_007101 [Heracleum sosnowskyi]|uniref:Terpene synthase metal-binding domain-containing protein n=1 Tax=Heracleum sosnowskyi TaxID=360622 RepID=A0AAD8J4T5_9APIA|nr:hypothetical protein POM88_007101 [Heracleum sosnowskyi]
MLYKQELSQVKRWWAAMEIDSKFPQFRSRVVEGYFWALGTSFQPCYALGRIMYTKVLCVVSVTDDLYDSYGTADELNTYTKAIQRLDIENIDGLPDHSKEISEAQDKFTNLLQKIYLEQPNNREIVRLVLGCVGRGGEGHSGQRIRDEILVLQRNNNCKGGMMEEWHQKLHNNSSPDDVVICEALLNYVRCGFRIDVYWKTLTERGLTKSVLASYDRPIVSEPKFSPDTKDGLIRDFTSYLKTLKVVHSGSDLESAIDICLSIPQVNAEVVQAF